MSTLLEQHSHLHRRAAFDVYHAYAGADSDSSFDQSPPVSPVHAKLSQKQFDPVTFDVLKVPPDDFASQITLSDLPVFQAIEPDELLTCGWTSKTKLLVSPNVVAFTRRFNHVCLWCQREILGRHKPKLRADVITHFIRIAKRLLDLNNLHSSLAVVSGLQSTSIHRLKASWAVRSLLAFSFPNRYKKAVPAKDKSILDKLIKLFSEENNFERMRKYTESVKLPCIPYLGLYLTDLVYIDVAHPRSGILNGGQRSHLMNNIIRMLAEFQRSQYSELPVVECVQSFLQSIRYIDELQKFIEDDLYRQSCELERPEHELSRSRDLANKSTVGPSLNASHSGVLLANQQSALDNMNRRESLPVIRDSPAPLTCVIDKNYSSKMKSLKQPINVSQRSFKRAHRKTQSLGNPSQFKFINESFNAQQLANEAQHLSLAARHLLDDSLLDVDYNTNTTNTATLCARNPANDRLSASTIVPAVSNDDSGLDTCDDRSKRSTAQSTASVSAVAGCSRQPSRLPSLQEHATFEGALTRKTLFKYGKRPRMSRWVHYWCSLWDTQLYYYASRHWPFTSAQNRQSYQNKPYKVVCVSGWMVLLTNDPLTPDTFQLQEPSKGHVYKCRARTEAAALQWTQHLRTAASKHNLPLPDNLIAFD